MYNLRRAVDGGWKDFKLNKDEAKKVQIATINKGLEVFALIDEFAKAKGVTLTPERAVAIFEKTAPEYTGLAIDYALQQYEAARAAQQKTAQAATAA